MLLFFMLFYFNIEATNEVIGSIAQLQIMENWMLYGLGLTVVLFLYLVGNFKTKIDCLSQKFTLKHSIY